MRGRSRAGNRPEGWSRALGALDGFGELRLADGPAMGSPERAGIEPVGAPARRLGAGTGRKERPGGAGSRLWPAHGRARRLGLSQSHSPHRELAPRWDGVARGRFYGRMGRRQGSRERFACCAAQDADFALRNNNSPQQRSFHRSYLAAHPGFRNLWLKLLTRRGEVWSRQFRGGHPWDRRWGWGAP